ncbi:Rv1733c family protein [Phaeacidiphilus oryzae]|jgi:hypothetical protein|uniref:Rv1733c family protein n=1 Tax=Phaeacidiphilus oryzae TaxID=348818 RepID=UPI00056C44E2|nr:hypothetical protein [Phaeacidiphilus oryzae]
MSDTADRRRGAAPEAGPPPRNGLRERVARNLRRALGRDPNPLVRELDRTRSRLLVLLGMLLAAVFVAAWCVGLITLRVSMAEFHRQHATRHRVVAVTTAPAYPRAGAEPTGGVSDGNSVAAAVWADSGGQRHSGLLRAPDGAPPGTPIPTWVDASGAPVAAPSPMALAVGNALIAGGGTLCGAIGIAVGVTGLTARLLDRRAGRVWEREWARVEPEWSRRHRNGG